MSNRDKKINFQLIYIIVNYGMGSRILHKAKEHGAPGGTVYLGRGTIDNSILNFLSIYEEKKEIVLIGTDNPTADRVLFELDREFQFRKPNHGIAFSISTNKIVGSKCYNCKEMGKKRDEERGVYNSMYQIIFTIVNRGKAEDVIEAAKAAGSKGGTIVNARGSGVHETSKLFNMDIEPEKEIVMILSKKDVTERIVSSIREKLEIDKPGNGIIFVQDVNKAYGIYE